MDLVLDFVNFATWLINKMRPNIRKNTREQDFGRVLAQHSRVGQQERHERNKIKAEIDTIEKIAPTDCVHTIMDS